MTAKIVATAAASASRDVISGFIERVERRDRAEIHILNFEDIARVQPQLTYSSIAWHFFFEGGTLKVSDLKQCDKASNRESKTEAVCNIADIATHNNTKDGVDACDRKVGTAFYAIKDGEAKDRLIGIVEAIAHCAKLQGDPALASRMAVVGVGASKAKWRGCSNSDQLDAALSDARLDRISELFREAKEIAVANASEELRPYLKAVELNAPSDENDLINFSDSRFAEAYYSDRSSRSDTGATPFNFTQAAYILLKNPAGCSVSKELQADDPSAPIP